MYRGDVAPYEVNKSLLAARANPHTGIRFVDWCPTGFKCGVAPNAPVNLPHSDMAPITRMLTAMFNNTVMGTVFGRCTHKYDLMFNKKAYIHWYVQEGLEEGEFN